MTLADDLAAVYTASTGAAPGPAFAGAVADVLAQNHIPLDSAMPPVFIDGLRQLARREPSATWSEVLPEDQGLAYILGELAPLIPGATYRHHEGRDELVVPALGLAAVVDASGGAERWAVVPHPPSSGAGAPAAEPVVLGTYDPVPAQIRRWASDPAVQFASQDESDAIEHESHLPLLAELAADPRCVKVPAILAALDQIVSGGLRRERSLGLARITAARAPADARATAGEPVPELTQRWLADLARIDGYAQATGPVSEPDARAIADVLLAGLRRPGRAITATSRADWWELAAGMPGQPPMEVLYVHAPTGTLHWANAPLTPAELAGLPISATRLG